MEFELYPNIIAGRKKQTQKKIGLLIDYYINNKFKCDLGVKEINEKFGIREKALNSFFGKSFTKIGRRKIYFIRKEYLKEFKKIKIKMNQKEKIKHNVKIKRFFLCYLSY